MIDITEAGMTDNATDHLTRNIDVSPHASTLRVAGITHPRLQRDYAEARALLAHHGTSYALATLMLPPAKRPSVWALYAFARYADEFVDSMTTPDPEALLLWGKRFMNSAEDLLGSGERREIGIDELTASDLDAIGRAMVHTMARWGIGIDLVQAFLASMAMDIEVTEYARYTDLELYMFGSAAVIGLQMLPILEPQEPGTEPAARALGEAFQLTNFIRDVGEDLDRGRCYLPLEILENRGVDLEALYAARHAPATPWPIRAALADLADITEDLYAAAVPGVDALHPTTRPGIQCAFRLYRQILHDARSADFDVLPRRTVVPRWKRARLALPAIAGAYAARATHRFGPATGQGGM